MPPTFHALRSNWPSLCAIAAGRTCTTVRTKANVVTLGMIDIGANLLDPMYQGVYHGKPDPYHRPDVVDVLRRARRAGLTKIIVTAGRLSEVEASVAFCRAWNAENDNEDSGSGSGSDVRGGDGTQQRLRLFTTVGVHPTRAGEWKEDPEGYMAGLEDVLRRDAASSEPLVVAIGECGLDYDRLEFCDRETQLECFRQHFRLAETYRLPMFLHSRNTGGEMVEVLKERARDMVKGGVVHSFDGTKEEMDALLEVRCGGGGEEAGGEAGGEAPKLYIGLNGCSLKTQENLDVVRGLPLCRYVWWIDGSVARETSHSLTRVLVYALTRVLAHTHASDRLMVETDAPWCGIRPTHSSYGYLKESLVGLPPQKDKKKWVEGGMVKGRNEPGCLGQVVEVVSGVMGVGMEEVAEAATRNTNAVFFSGR